MFRTRSALALLLTALAWSVSATLGVAQSGPLEKARAQRAEVLPHATEDPEPGMTRRSEDGGTEEPAPDDTPLGVDLSAIRLIPDQDQTDAGTAPGSEPIEVAEGVSAPADLKAKLEPLLGTPLSMALLADLAKTVIEAWRNEDFPIVDVYFPEQDITAGRVQVVVREALLGEVRINDVVHSDPAYLKGNIRLAPGDRIDRRVLETDLDWLNRNPIRRVNLIYDRGTEDGTSDVVLDTIEEDPFTVYAGLANTGVPLTGEHEWSAGFNWLNPLGGEQSAGYQFGANLDFETLESHTAMYRAFLPWRHELRLLGAAVFSDVPADPADPAAVGIGGENLQATIDYVIPLPRLRSFRGLRHEFSAGLDWKSTNTDLIFGGFNAIASSAEIFQFRTAYEAVWKDRLGYQLVSLASIWSPGNVLNHNDDPSFDALRQDATADYWYGYAEIERGLKLPAEWNLILRGRGHLTDDRLLSTEQLLAGGYLTVRGFDENFTRGDSGAILNLELVSPPFSLLGRVNPKCRDEWNALFFYDGAALTNSDPLPGELSPGLQSTGLGFNCRIGETAFLRAAYGWVLQTSGVDETGMADGRMHFGVTVNY
jgi:hemolysin activation/secretion protein